MREIRGRLERGSQIECVLYFRAADDLRGMVRAGRFRAVFIFFFPAEDGLRALVRSRGLGAVYKRLVFPLEFKH